MGPMGHQAENYFSADPAKQYGASYRGPGYRITSKDPSLTEEQRNRTNNMMLGLAPGQDITDSRRNMGMTREVGDYLNSLNSYQAAQNELEKTPMSALQGKAEAWKGSLEAERQQANINKSISEVQSLQEQVDKANQAKGITTLAQEKDIFGSPNIGNPGRGFTQPTDLTQQNLGIQGLKQTPTAGNDDTGGGSIYNTTTVQTHPETGLPTQPTEGVDGWTDPTTGNTFYNSDHNWNNYSQGPVSPISGGGTDFSPSSGFNGDSFSGNDNTDGGYDSGWGDDGQGNTDGEW